MGKNERGTVDITADFATTGESVVLDAEDNDVLGVYIRGDAAASYDIDVSPTPGSADYYEGAETLSGAADYNEGYFEAARYVRVKVSSGGGTGGTGDTADVFVTSSGGGDR